MTDTLPYNLCMISFKSFLQLHALKEMSNKLWMEFAIGVHVEETRYMSDKLNATEMLDCYWLSEKHWYSQVFRLTGVACTQDVYPKTFLAAFVDGSRNLTWLDLFELVIILKYTWSSVTGGTMRQVGLFCQLVTSWGIFQWESLCHPVTIRAMCQFGGGRGRILWSSQF